MSKALQFLSEVKAELSKVVWPSKEQVVKYTGAVIVFSIVLSLILGAADFGLIKLVEKVVNQ